MTIGIQRLLVLPYVDGTLPGPPFGPPLARFALTCTLSCTGSNGANHAKGRQTLQPFRGQRTLLLFIFRVEMIWSIRPYDSASSAVRILSRSMSSRIFSIGTLPEVTRTAPNTTPATAMELKLGSVCNAVMTVRAADYYAFEGRKGQRVAVDCASRGIDSKLEPVVVLADGAGRDLVVVHSEDEAVETYRELLADPGAAEELGRNARERVLEEHTYAQRARRLLELVGVRDAVGV